MKYFGRSFLVNYFTGLISYNFLKYATKLINGSRDIFGRGEPPTTNQLLSGLTIYLVILMVAVGINAHYYNETLEEKQSSILIFIFGLHIFILGVFSHTLGISLPEFF
jgi:hypothetical protein